MSVIYFNTPSQGIVIDRGNYSSLSASIPVDSFWFCVRLIGPDHWLLFPTPACHVCSDFRVLSVREGSPSVGAISFG